MIWNPRLFMTRDQIREYDRIAIEEAEIPGMVLMENAGAGAARIAREMLGAGRRVHVVCGPGNNGGDGFVIARHLQNQGVEVSTFLAVPAARLAGDALSNFRILEGMGADIEDISETPTASGLARRLAGAHLVIDALLGTGVSRPVGGRLGEIIEAVNACGAPVLAVDIPSGLDADSGRPLGGVVLAAVTATFAHPKRGLVLHPGAALAGRLEVVSIGAPGWISKRAGWDGEIIDGAALLGARPVRAPDSHKGTFGHLLILAGSLGKSGAAALAGEAALRSGAGLVTVATDAATRLVLEARCRAELMTEQVLDDGYTTPGENDLARLARLLEGKTALVVGPGLSSAPGISDLATHLLGIATVPMVVDADGIGILAAMDERSTGTGAPLVLTPHPGEMSRLIRKDVAEVQGDRIAAAREAATRFEAVVALKGARTVVASPTGSVWINTTGNPGMATAGTGDVLAGIIGALLAQGMNPLEATLLGVFVHGRAGDLAAAHQGAPGMIAKDLTDELPGLWAGRNGRG